MRIMNHFMSRPFLGLLRLFLKLKPSNLMQRGAKHALLNTSSGFKRNGENIHSANFLNVFQFRTLKTPLSALTSTPFLGSFSNMASISIVLRVPDEFNYGSSASPNVRVRDHLMSLPSLVSLGSFFIKSIEFGTYVRLKLLTYIGPDIIIPAIILWCNYFHFNWQVNFGNRRILSSQFHHFLFWLKPSAFVQM